MENIDPSAWAVAHPKSVHPLNNPLLSLAIRVLQFFRSIRKVLAVLNLAPKRDEIVLVVPEGAWSVLEETLQLDAVSPMFAAHLRREITKALQAVRLINLNEVQVPDIFAPMLVPTYTVTCRSKQIMAEVVSTLSSNGCILFVDTPTGGEYEINVRDDQRHALDAAFLAANNLLTPSLSVAAQHARLDQAYEERASGADTDHRHNS